MLEACRRHLLWLFFLRSSPFAEDECLEAHEMPSGRWRLLGWCLVLLAVWERLDNSLVNFITVTSLLSLLALTVSLVLTKFCLTWSMAEGWLLFVLTTCIIGGLTIMTSQPGFQRYDFLARKLILHEYDLVRSWCPDTCVTVVSIIVMSCLVRGLHKDVTAFFTKSS